MTDIDMTREIYVGQQTSYETRRAYDRDLRVFFEWLGQVGKQVEEIGRREAIDFRDMLTGKYAPNGAARVWSTVKGLYSLAELPNPFSVIKGPKRIKNRMPKTPDDDSVDALVGVAGNHPQRSLIISMLLNGLRASEVGGMLKTDIEHHQGATILRVVGKGSKERMVPAINEVERSLVRYNMLATPGQTNSPYVVSDPFGKPLNYRQIEHAVYKTAEYADIEGMHPHALRHHYATRLLRNGVDVRYVQMLLGHERLDTTAQYLGLSLEDLINASRKDPRNTPHPKAMAV